jgi:hypothetical protein
MSDPLINKRYTTPCGRQGVFHARLGAGLYVVRDDGHAETRVVDVATIEGEAWIVEDNHKPAPSLRGFGVIGPKAS